MSGSIDRVWRLCGSLVVGLLGTAKLACQTILQTFPMHHAFDTETLIGDVDADGVRDLAIERWVSTGSNSIDVYSMRTGALLHQFMPPPQQGYRQVFRVGDIDADGHDDVAHHELWWGVSSFTVIRSGRTGAYLRRWPLRLPLVGLDDVNADGHDEVILVDSMAAVGGIVDAGRSDVLDGATGQVLWSHLGTVSGQQLHARRILGDLDNDGTRDYLVMDNLRYWGFSGSNGAQIFSFPKLSQTYGEELTDIGDFNADGFDDIVFLDRGFFPFHLYQETLVFAGPSATQLLWSHLMLASNPGPIWYGRPLGHLGDVDGDGHSDLGLQGGLQGAGGASSTVLSGRDQSVVFTTSSNPSLPAALAPEIGGPGDVDGDGFPDFLLSDTLQPGVYALHLISGAPPGVTPVGPGCASPTGATPTIGVGIGARLGRTMTVNLANANPNLFAAVLAGGLSDQQWNGAALPFDLGFVGMPGCSWRVSAEAALLLPTAGANGTPHHAQYAVPVPQVPALLGTALFWQWFVLEPGSPGLAGSVTAAVRTVVVQ